MRKILLIAESNASNPHLEAFSKNIGDLLSGTCTHAIALSSIEQNSPDVLLMAFGGEEMVQLDLLGEIRLRFPTIPVILLTTGAITRSVLEALQKGAVDIISTQRGTHDPALLLDNVVRLTRVDRRVQRLMGLVCHSESQFCLENDPELIMPLVNHLQECAGRMKGMDDSHRAQLGIALNEALLNAMYHGNLEVSSDLRQKSEAAFLTVARARQQTAPYKERRVHVRATVTLREARYVIRDEGPGFDPAALPDPTLPDNLTKSSGRGILLMKSFVETLRYNQAGNELTLIKKISDPPKGGACGS